MKQYKVTFEHYIDAETPQAAAAEALRIARDSASLMLLRVALMETLIKEGERWIGYSDDPNALDRVGAAHGNP